MHTTAISLYLYINKRKKEKAKTVTSVIKDRKTLISLSLSLRSGARGSALLELFFFEFFFLLELFRVYNPSDSKRKNCEAESSSR